MPEPSRNKSGRTPEQQAARDARKAAKAAADPAAASTDVKMEDGPESSAQAIKRAAKAGQRSKGGNAKEVSKVAKKEDKLEDEAGGAEGSGDEDELEIDLNAPMPMSKAEARAARKKAKQGIIVPPKPAEKKGDKKRKRPMPMSDDEDDKPTKDTEGKESRPKKVKTEPKNSVWIGNLPYRFSKTDLRDWFVTHLQEKGEDVQDTSITRINLPKQPGNGTFANNKGFAYVDFNTEELQQKAVGLSETMLQGRRVLIKFGDDHNTLPDARTPRPVKIIEDPRLPAQPHGESSTLFMGNLPWDATEELLRELVESNADATSAIPEPAPKPVSVGDAEADPAAPAITPDLDAGREGKASGLRKVRVGTFEDSGNCKGFAFLDFLTPRHATVALSKKGNRMFHGRQLVLQYASAEATKRGTSKHMTGPSKTKGVKGEQKGVQSERVKRFAGRSAWTKRDSARDADREAVGETEAAGKSAHRSTSTNDFAIASQIVDKLDDATPATSKQERGPRGDGKRGKKWEATGRPRPGAALAMAKREKVGIVESQGKKIVF